MNFPKDLQQKSRNNQIFKKNRVFAIALLRWVPSAIAAALAIWMTIAWIHLVGTVIRYYSPLPFWDYWETIPRFERFVRYDLVNALWQQHNEHRIVFPNLIFDADYLFLAGREILPLTLNVVFYFGTWLVLSLTFYRASVPLQIRVGASLMAGIVMAWEAAALEMAGAILIVWPLMLVSAAMALSLLTHVPGGKYPWRYLSAAIGCAVVSNYSLSNGLFLWPIMIAAAWLLHLSRVQLAVLAISAVAFVAIYFIGYRFSNQLNLGILWHHPIYALQFISAYLGVPFTVARPALGITMGIVLVTAFLICGVRAARRNLLNSKMGVVLFGVYTVCLLSAVLTAVGRMDPRDPGFGAATAQRYVVVPLVADASLLLIIAWLYAARQTYLWATVSVAFVVGLYSTGRSPVVQSWCEFVKIMLRNTQFVSLAVQSGVDDPTLLRSVYPDVGAVKQRLAILRKDHLSSFADHRAEWLGKTVSSVVRFTIDAAKSGAITGIHSVPDGLVVTGWTDGQRSIRSPQWLVFVNDQRKVVGFGEKLPGGLPRDLQSLNTPQSFAWVGFVNANIPSSSFAAYALELNGKALIRIGEVTSARPPT
ncbi:MAG TPA: hypothetical protein VFA65_00350 [Bryobacteraceae bacterium]|nr:hypothetical protein [Bryobacteraceae bacterium]